MVQLIKCLSNKHEDLTQIPSTGIKTGNSDNTIIIPALRSPRQADP